MTILEIGCCGAYCKTCIQYHRERYPNGQGCQGCKMGYENGSRKLERAKCKIKICSFKEKGLKTCADCSEFPCIILETFYSKGRKKYRKHIDFIRENGYEQFLKHANQWNGPTGKLDARANSMNCG